MAWSSVELLVMALALTHTLPEKPAFAYPEVAALLMAGFLASWRLERQIPLTWDLATLGSDVDLPLPPVHGRYSRTEILAAFAALDDRGAPRSHREALFSPNTRYRELALGPGLFHWESQSTTTAAFSTGQRCISGRSRVLLFVREQRRQGTITEPFLCLRCASYMSHEDERPMA